MYVIAMERSFEEAQCLDSRRALAQSVRRMRLCHRPLPPLRRCAHPTRSPLSWKQLEQILLKATESDWSKYAAVEVSSAQ